MSKWFDNLEDIKYSIVEYIPYVGTLYSLDRARKAYRANDWTRHYQSVGNLVESSVRDVILFNGIAELSVVAIIHTMAESFTDKMIEIYHHEPTKDMPRKRVTITTQTLDNERGHVIIAGPRDDNLRKKSSDLVFRGKAKGMHLFHGAVFTGMLIQPKFAPNNGQKIRLNIPEGLYEGAPVTFSWKWTIDAYGNTDSRSATYGRIKLNAGTTTGFQLSSRKGADGWQGYDFWGQVESVNKIKATTRIGGVDVEIDFERLPGTRDV